MRIENSRNPLHPAEELKSYLKQAETGQKIILKLEPDPEMGTVLGNIVWEEHANGMQMFQVKNIMLDLSVTGEDFEGNHLVEGVIFKIENQTLSAYLSISNASLRIKEIPNDRINQCQLDLSDCEISIDNKPSKQGSVSIRFDSAERSIVDIDPKKVSSIPPVRPQIKKEVKAIVRDTKPDIPVIKLDKPLIKATPKQRTQLPQGATIQGMPVAPPVPTSEKNRSGKKGGTGIVRRLKTLFKK